MTARRPEWVTWEQTRRRELVGLGMPSQLAKRLARQECEGRKRLAALLGADVVLAAQLTVTADNRLALRMPAIASPA